MRIIILLGFVLAISAVQRPVYAQRAVETPAQGGYSTEPLKEPIFDAAAVVVRSTELNNWLASNLRSLKSETVAAPREDLYYLIDSKVKQIAADGKRVLPVEHDPILAMLFSWAEPLGVYGGAQVFNALKRPDEPSQKSLMPVPDSMTLRLENDTFSIKSNRGWSVRVPYYFMITGMIEGEPQPGIPEQLLMISTGATRDKSALSYSQATLMFVHSPPKVPFEKLERRWMRVLGPIDSVAKKPLNIRGIESRHMYAAETKMHMEVATWSDAGGSFIVLYGGIDGTYQWNRPHFLDFIRSITSSNVTLLNKQ